MLRRSPIQLSNRPRPPESATLPTPTDPRPMRPIHWRAISASNRRRRPSSCARAPATDRRVRPIFKKLPDRGDQAQFDSGIYRRQQGGREQATIVCMIRVFGRGGAAISEARRLAIPRDCWPASNSRREDQPETENIRISAMCYDRQGAEGLTVELMLMVVLTSPDAARSKTSKEKEIAPSRTRCFGFDCDHRAPQWIGNGNSYGEGVASHIYTDRIDPERLWLFDLLAFISYRSSPNEVIAFQRARSRDVGRHPARCRSSRGRRIRCAGTIDDRGRGVFAKSRGCWVMPTAS